MLTLQKLFNGINSFSNLHAMKKILWVSFVMTFTCLGYSQTKYEKEVRIKTDQVPHEAVSYVRSFGFLSKIKWYEEFSEVDSTFEAKTKHSGKHYSIEFSELGILEDIEIKIKWGVLSKDVQQAVLKDLESRYGKFKINKIQIQYSGNPDAIRSFILEGSGSEQIIVRVYTAVNTAGQTFATLSVERPVMLNY